MTARTQAVFDAARALPEEERAELVECLLATLPDDLEELTEDEFAAELDRRRLEIESGAVKPIPWSDVKFPQ